MKEKNTAIEFTCVSDKGYTAYCYLIRSLPDGVIVGECCLRIGEGLDGIGNIGYSVDEEYRGRGHATSACALILLVARTLGLQKAYAVCKKDNLPSIRVCEKLGAAPIGETENCVRFCFYLKK